MSFLRDTFHNAILTKSVRKLGNLTNFMIFPTYCDYMCIKFITSFCSDKIIFIYKIKSFSTLYNLYIFYLHAIIATLPINYRVSIYIDSYILHFETMLCSNKMANKGLSTKVLDADQKSTRRHKIVPENE